jgi:hypothetical protein
MNHKTRHKTGKDKTTTRYQTRQKKHKTIIRRITTAKPDTVVTRIVHLLSGRIYKIR